MTIRAWLGAGLAVAFGWIALLMAVMYFANAAPEALVFFGDDAFLTRLPAQVAIVDMGPHWAVLSSAPQGLAQGLYAAGAWVVLPAGLRGCLG